MLPGPATNSLRDLGQIRPRSGLVAQPSQQPGRKSSAVRVLGDVGDLRDSKTLASAILQSRPQGAPTFPGERRQRQKGSLTRVATDPSGA